jgi:hypothetical protein
VKPDSITDLFIQWFDAEEAQELARQTGWFKRKGKIHPLDFLLSLTFGQLSALRLSLSAQAQSLEQPVSPQALDQRYNPAAVKYFAASFERSLQRALSSPVPEGLAPAQALGRHFRAVYLSDSTAFDVPASLQQLYPSCGGGGSTANVKVLLRYEVLQGRLEPLRVLPGKRSDQGLGRQLAEQLREGELQINDNGFYGAAAWQAAQECQAYLLSPVPHSVSLWLASGPGQPPERLDLAKALAHCGEPCQEWSALYLGQEQHRVGPLRVVAFRLSPESAGRRRAALRESMRTKGRTPSREALELAGWLILATNASAQQLPTAVMGYLYRVRWQVELAFRQCKWVLRMDQTLSGQACRVQCEIWARLLAAVLIFAWHAHANAISWATCRCEASFEKVSCLFQQWGHTLARAFWLGAQRLREDLQDLWRRTLKLARKGRQKTRTNTWDRLWDNWLKPKASHSATPGATAAH